MSVHDDKSRGTGAESEPSVAETELLVGGGHKPADKPTGVWESYEEYIKEYMLNIRPHLITALVLTLLFGLAWIAFYGYNIMLMTALHHPCARNLENWLGIEGIIGIVANIFLFAVVGLSFNLLYNTKPNQLPRATAGLVVLITVYIILSALQVAWWFVGSVWLLQTGSRTKFDCDARLFHYSFWFLTIGWMWYGLVAIMACVLSACLPPVKRPEDSLQALNNSKSP